MSSNQDVSIIEFDSFQKSVAEIMDLQGMAEELSRQEKILIKPNLVISEPHPITTSVDCIDALVAYVKEHSDAEIVIAEGCGSFSEETTEVFSQLGYDTLVDKYGVSLVDFNHAPVQKLERPDCRIFKEMVLPKILFNHFVISVPVLKAHSLSDITGTLKNMIGAAPHKYYSGSYGSWRKSVFHNQIHESIVQLNIYRSADFSLLDASIGMPDFHLGGSVCDPPVNRLVAGRNPWQVDRTAAELLGFDWKRISHLSLLSEKRWLESKVESVAS